MSEQPKEPLRVRRRRQAEIGQEIEREVLQADRLRQIYPDDPPKDTLPVNEAPTGILGKLYPND